MKIIGHGNPNNLESPCIIICSVWRLCTYKPYLIRTNKMQIVKIIRGWFSKIL
jgi:hypothetical protein